jgi:hypothetical protein
VNKTGDYSHNVTSRELRYVYRNWDRFQDSVLFYNGYNIDKKVVMVVPPWDTEGDTTQLFTDHEKLKQARLNPKKKDPVIYT